MASGYGGRGREWHPDFLDYMVEIVQYPNYDGIPGGLDAEGRVDWTIPSNRKEGSKNWDGNARRRDWWRLKATELGVPLEGAWLSKTARQNHPLKKKPCQICGKWMSVLYVYPSARGKIALESAFPGADFHWINFPTVFEIAENLRREVGETTALNALLRAFPVEEREQPNDWKSLVEYLGRLVADCSRLLSPGAMSNCPDRLDGFHTYNLCCRKKQDTGRASENMARYVVDRRAYEHWAEGEWDVADLVMKAAGQGLCANRQTCLSGGEIVQLSADHVGPISLGFKHSPFFEPLCLPCNSAKQNRMGLRDVQSLTELESRGYAVISWQARHLWHCTSDSVDSDAGAVLLSRLLRINQDAFLHYLHKGAQSSHPEALLQFLNLQLAAQRIEELRVDPQTLVVAGYRRSVRQGTYMASRVERVLRVAYTSLVNYAAGARNIHDIDESQFAGAVDVYEQELDRCVPPNAEIAVVGESLRNLVSTGDAGPLSHSVGAHYIAILSEKWATYARVKRAIDDVMQGVQDQLIARFRRGDHRRPEWSAP